MIVVNKRLGASWWARFRCQSYASRVPTESGDTLIEVLIALVIIGITVVAFLGTLMTSITSSGEYRTLATVDTVLKNLGEVIKDDIQGQATIPSIYQNCATTYQVATEYPTSAAVGAGVTVFGTDLTPGQAVTISVGGVTIPTANFIPSSPLPPEVASDGTVSATFTLPASVPAGPSSGPAVSDNVLLQTGPPPTGTPPTVSVPSALPLAVTAAPSPPIVQPVSAVTNYEAAISSVSWWNNASRTWDSLSNETQTQCQANPSDASGIQEVTEQVTAADKVTDTLSVVVTNPAYSVPPGPAMTVTAAPPCSPANPTPGQQITFCASTTESNGNVPTGTISWVISGSATPVACSNANSTGPPTSNGTTATWTCVLAASLVGANTYQAVAYFSGDVNYGPSTATGSVTVAPFSIVSVLLKGAPGNTHGQIEKGDSVVIQFSAPINVTAFCSSWAGPGNQSLGSDNTIATITDGPLATDDLLSVSRTNGTCGSNDINFGSIDLGSPLYVSGGDVIFGNSTNSTIITWTANSDTLTIQLGHQRSGSGSPGTTAQVPSSAPIYTSTVTDQVGDPTSNSPFPVPAGVQF